jgi:hypothetical protein
MPLEELLAVMSPDAQATIRRVLEAAQARKAERSNPIVQHERRMLKQATRRAAKRRMKGDASI